MKILPDRDNVRNWYVNEDHLFVFEGHMFIVRKGYRFDGHSVPFFAKWFFKPEVNIEAAMLHDYILDTMPWHRFGRRFAARAYVDIMQTDTWLRRNVMPAVVTAAAYIKTFVRGDYRGEVKPNTVVDVSVV
jgi:hypothetical protein